MKRTQSRKAFRAKPVNPGPISIERARKARNRKRFGELALFGSVVGGIFVIGVVLTHWSAAKQVVGQLGTGTSSDCTWMSVHDGDTIRCGAERIRIANIDAPELPGSPKCEGYRARTAWCDFDKGYASRDALNTFLKRGPVKLRREGADKYGRTLARVAVNGQDAGEFLVGLGLAKRWD